MGRQINFYMDKATRCAFEERIVSLPNLVIIPDVFNSPTNWFEPSYMNSFSHIPLEERFMYICSQRIGELKIEQIYNKDLYSVDNDSSSVIRCKAIRLIRERDIFWIIGLMNFHVRPVVDILTNLK